MQYVVAYDVADDRRRQQVATLLAAWGRRVQKSVFECEWNRTEMETTFARVAKLLKLQTDRCHIFQVCGECYPKRLVKGTELEEKWKETITTW
jgi:CRISPR-associated protein Cas2